MTNEQKPGKSLFLFTGVISYTVHTDRGESIRPTDISTWVATCFAAAVLLLGVYLQRVKITPVRVSPHHGSYPSMVVMFTLTWNRFSPSVTVHRPPAGLRIAVGISVVVVLSRALGKTAQVLIVFRTSHTVMKLYCSTHQRFRTVTVLFIRFICSPAVQIRV